MSPDTLCRAGVIGSPIAHSLSPVLHRAAYRALGLEHWEYLRHEVGPGDVASFVAGLEESWVGLSVTMPGKEEALAFADEVTARAQLSGAANTLVREHGGWRADNTDIDGITTALREAGASRPRAGWVVGSGATARSALIALAGMGAASVYLQVRSEPRAATLDLAADLGVEVTVVDFEEHQGGPSVRDVDIAISTVPAGTAPLPTGGVNGVAHDNPAHATPAHDTERSFGLVVLDVAYHPRRSEWATAWARRGACVVDGASMLLHQAAAQVELMTGRPAPLEVMRAALLRTLEHEGSNPW